MELEYSQSNNRETRNYFLKKQLCTDKTGLASLSEVDEEKKTTPPRTTHPPGETGC